MVRQWLCIVVGVSQAAFPSGVNHWNLLELFTLYPQLPEGGESSYGDRGSHSSPDPEEDALWLWWFIKVWWLSLIKFTDSGLVWCGALCTSVGIAARWSYWLAVAVVGIFILQLLFWTITWVLCPFLRHVTALYRYIRGHGGWHEVTTLQGTPVFRPKWVGPKGQSAWSAEFVQQEVRGRGENRDPFDLLVTDGVAITRLRHGTLRGRTNRNGYRLNGGTVHGASRRYFRNQIGVLWYGDPLVFHTSLWLPRGRLCAHYSLCYDPEVCGTEPTGRGRKRPDRALLRGYLVHRLPMCPFLHSVEGGESVGALLSTIHMLHKEATEGTSE